MALSEAAVCKSCGNTGKDIQGEPCLCQVSPEVRDMVHRLRMDLAQINPLRVENEMIKDALHLVKEDVTREPIRIRRKTIILALEALHYCDRRARP
jgi:hypothetical protein